MTSGSNSFQNSDTKIIFYQKNSVFVIGASKLPINFRLDLYLDYMPAIPAPSTPSLEKHCR